MKGSYCLKLRSHNISYELNIYRNITILNDNSGTGKTVLITYLTQSKSRSRKSGIYVEVNANWAILNEDTWNHREDYVDCILFADESNYFIYTNEFAKYVKESGNYFVIVTRFNFKKLSKLPFSYKSILCFRNTNRLNFSEQKFESYDIVKEIPDLIITEDSKSGFEFFKAVSDRLDIECISAEGKAKIAHIISNEYSKTSKNILIIADGAAFGSEISDLLSVIEMNRLTSIQLWLPESFEYLLLSSPMFSKFSDFDSILSNLPDIIGSDYFSWENFFEDLLITATSDKPCTYTKSSLNDCYIKDCCCIGCKCPMYARGNKLDIILGSNGAVLHGTKQELQKDIIQQSNSNLKTLDF